MYEHPGHRSDPPDYSLIRYCTEGNNIEPENRRSGTDGRPLCENC